MKNSLPPAAAPVIETPRLRLRGFVASDLPDFCALWNEPEVWRYITGMPLPEEEHWGRLLKLIGHWPALGFGYWAIMDKASGALIGQCGFGSNRRAMTPPMPEPEIGWVLRAAWHGQGLGHEAAAAAQSWFDRSVAEKRTACIIDPGNTVSQKLAVKLGYTCSAEATYKDKPVLLFHRQR